MVSPHVRGDILTYRLKTWYNYFISPTFNVDLAFYKIVHAKVSKDGIKNGTTYALLVY